MTLLFPPFVLGELCCQGKGTFPMGQLFRIRWPKYWSFSFSISPSNEYSGLISLKIDWFDLLAGQGTVRSLLHHHSSKTSILWHSTFFKVQLSQLYMSTRKNTALTIQTFVGKVVSLLFKTLSRFVIAFLSRSKCPLISWLQSPSAVILTLGLADISFPSVEQREVLEPVCGTEGTDWGVWVCLFWESLTEDRWFWLTTGSLAWVTPSWDWSGYFTIWTLINIAVQVFLKGAV